MSRLVEFFSTENVLKRINMNYTPKSKAIHVPNTAFAKKKKSTTLNQSSKELEDKYFRHMSPQQNFNCNFPQLYWIASP